MDDRGHWHHHPVMQESKSEPQSGSRPRFVVDFEIGSTVEVKRGDDTLIAEFQSVEKNKVTLQPISEVGKPMPFLEFTENVTLSNGRGGRAIRAQVWDTRGGKLILRTLPL